MRKNAFQEIEPTDKLPERVKAETLGNLGAMAFIMDMVDLFITNGGRTLVDGIQPNNTPTLLDDFAPGQGD